MLLNPGAGAGNRADDIRAALDQAGVQATIVEAAGERLETETARAISRGDLVVAAGGDGTVSSVASVVVRIGVAMAVLPAGTLNHFAKDAGISTDLAAAAGLLRAAAHRRVDVGEANGRTFVNNASLGLYPRLVREREQERQRGRSRWMAFALALLRVWRRHRTFTVRLRIDGRDLVRRTPFVFVGNGRYESQGLRLGARSSLDTGTLSAFVAPRSGRFDLLRVALRALAGRLENEEKFEEFEAREITIETARSPIGVALDGEVVQLRIPLRFRSRPAALEILVPQG